MVPLFAVRDIAILIRKSTGEKKTQPLYDEEDVVEGENIFSEKEGFSHGSVTIHPVQ